MKLLFKNLILNTVWIYIKVQRFGLNINYHGIIPDMFGLDYFSIWYNFTPMNKLILLLLLSTLTSCSRSIKIYENDQLVKEITTIPKSDTTINIKDYYITYKQNGAYLEGFVENTFDDNKRSFKTSGSVEIEIGEGKFGIRR